MFERQQSYHEPLALYQDKWFLFYAGSGSGQATAVLENWFFCRYFALTIDKIFPPC